MRTKATSKSKIQYEIGKLIEGRYPLDTILEEVSIPDSRLSIDFFIPARRIAFEIQGDQHSSFNVFFHGNRKGFVSQKKRDADKKFFCELNNIELVYFHSIDEAKEYFDI